MVELSEGIAFHGIRAMYQMSSRKLGKCARLVVLTSIDWVDFSTVVGRRSLCVRRHVLDIPRGFKRPFEQDLVPKRLLLEGTSTGQYAFRDLWSCAHMFGTAIAQFAWPLDVGPSKLSHLTSLVALTNDTARIFGDVFPRPFHPARSSLPLAPFCSTVASSRSPVVSGVPCLAQAARDLLRAWECSLL